MNVPSNATIKIAYIGGGSRAWAPKLMSDLALSPHLDGEMALYDVNLEAARANVEVGKVLFSHPDAKSRFHVHAVEQLEDALDGAAFVVLSIEPGPITMRYADLEIPRAHGIVQTVGDTAGPGGMLRALRAVPLYDDFAHEIMEHCPSAWVINYTNPMSVCTAALYESEPTIKAFGCCHEVFGTQERLARLVAKWFEVDVPARREIELDIAGVNHFTFASTARWNGEDLLARLRDEIAAPGFFSDRTREAAARKKSEDWFESDGLIAYDFLRRFDVLGAAGDRHLAEFVPWYLRDEASIMRWGVVVTPYEWRLQRMSDVSDVEAASPLAPSGEEGVEQIHALLGFEELLTNVNLPNRGQVPDLPSGAVVESYALLSRNSVRPVTTGPLPEMLQSHIRGIADLQRATLQAAFSRDLDLAFQALLCDPLMTIATDEARAMFVEMVDYARDQLPFSKPT